MHRIAAIQTGWHSWLLWSYLGFVLAAETVTAVVGTTAGVAFHAGLLLVLTLHAGLGQHEPTRRLALVLLVAPIVRLLSLTLPLASLPRLAWYPLLLLPVLVVVWLMVRQLQLSRRDLGVRLGNPLAQVMIGSAGLGVGVLQYQLMPTAGLVDAVGWNVLALAGVLALLTSGILEEVIFRGLLQSTVLAAFGRWGLLYGAMLFAALHVGYLSWQHLLFALVLGLFFAYAAYRSASLVGVALAHALANVVAQQAMPWLAQRAPAQVPVVVQATLAALLLASLSMLALLGWRARQRGRAARRPAVLPSLRDVRRQAGLRHTELAQRTGIPARTLAEVELGITIFTEEQRQRIGEVFGLRILRFAEEPGN